MLIFNETGINLAFLYEKLNCKYSFRLVPKFTIRFQGMLLQVL